jgi:hypothetical protein
MKTAILLSGLQRNFEPFIMNQLECVIKRFNCDVFMFTSNENNNRYVNRVNDKFDINYKIEKDIDNDSIFFYNKYGDNLKDICIDNDNKLFNEFISSYDFSNTINFHKNLISAYFKVHKCVELMENYETKNNIRYDRVIRARLDFFVDNKIRDDINLLDVRNTVYGSKFISNHEDDCFFVMNRENINLFKNFVFKLIEIRDRNECISVESELKNCISSKTNLEFLYNLGKRISSKIYFRDIPYFNEEDITKLKSLEYKIVY